MLYRCKTNINNGKYKEGDIAEFTGKEAEELLRLGAIEPVRKPFSREAGPVQAVLQQQGH